MVTGSRLRLLWRAVLRAWHRPTGESVEEAAASGWPLLGFVAFGLAAVVGLVWWLNPAPPDVLRLAGGPPGSAYEVIAKRYAEILRRQGVKVDLLPSAGSRENLEALLGGAKPADAALVQGGVDLPAGAEERLRTLGSVAYEPVWVFYRGNFEIEKLRQLIGWRISVGAEGSGLRGLALKLLSANELPLGERMIALSGLNAAEAIQQSQIDATFVIASQDSPVVQVLLRTPGISLMGFAQADAYVKQFPFLSKIVLPQGAVDLVRDFPAESKTLLATTTNLVAREDLHPALQSMLLQAAAEVHRPAGFFNARGDFPAIRDQTFLPSLEAERFYRSGPPFLQRYLPYWAAVWVDRLVFLMLPIVVLVLPALRLAPAIYRWRMRSRIFRWYGDLKFLENEIRHRYDPARRAEYLDRLDAIEESAYHRRVPLAFADLVYTLREHVELVRRMLDRIAARGLLSEQLNEQISARTTASTEEIKK